MSSLEFGRIVLRNSLIEYMALPKPFAGHTGTLNHRYYFSERCNESMINLIINKSPAEAIARRNWGQKLRNSNGQAVNHPTIGWFVGKLLSTTSLVIRDDSENAVFWDVYRNNQPEARGLEMLAQQNQCWGDWTLAKPIETTVYA